MKGCRSAGIYDLATVPIDNFQPEFMRTSIDVLELEGVTAVDPDDCIVHDQLHLMLKLNPGWDKHFDSQVARIAPDRY